MAVKVAINGFGRIGRLAYRAMVEQGLVGNAIDVVAVGDIVPADNLAYLVKYDSTQGSFPGEVTHQGDDTLIVNGDEMKVVSAREPSGLPWKELGVDVVIESTGLFTQGEKAKGHIDAGAKKVIISAPGGKDIDATIVYGVNHTVLKSSDEIISNASCTTNCLAPLVQPLHENIGIKSGVMTTIHSYTNDQVLTDVYHTDLRRARSATQSMIPTKTGAASAVGLVLPELQGKLDGFSVRVPTINVSLVDLSFVASRATTVEEIHEVVKEASSGDLQGVLDYSDGPLVSIDFNHNPASSTYDATMTKVQEGTLVKVCSWYDNEWGFSNRMLDTTLALINAD